MPKQRSIAYGIVALTVLLTAGSVYCQNADSVVVLDVHSAVEMAFRLNPNLKIAKDQESIADAQAREIRSFVLPQLSVVANYTRNIKKPAFFANFGGTFQAFEIGANNVYVGNIRLRQRIYENGQLGLGKAREIATLLTDMTQEATRLTKDQIILGVRQAYYTVLLNQEVVEVFEQTYSQSKAHHDNVQKLYDQGMAAEFDLLRSEVQVAEVEPELIAVQNRLELSKNALKKAIGLPLQTRIALLDSLQFLPRSQEEITAQSQEGLRRRPEMRQIERQERIAQLNVAITRGARLPTLSLSGNYQFLGQSDDFAFSAVERNTSFSATLDLQFNLFDGFATSARIQQAKAELSRIRHQKEELQQAIEIDIQQAVLRMAESQERIRSQRKSVQQAEKAYQIAEVRYNQGIGTQLELFDTRLALNNIKTNYLRAVFDYMIALTSWQKAVGIIQ